MAKQVDRSAEWNQYLLCRLLRNMLVAGFQWTKHVCGQIDVDRSADGSSWRQASETY